MLVSTILPLAPGLVERLTAGIDVADVGTGQGYAVHVLARALPKSRFTGFDFSRDAVAAARKGRPKNAEFRVQDIAKLKGCFDLICAFDTIHDQAKPVEMIRAAGFGTVDVRHLPGDSFHSFFVAAR